MDNECYLISKCEIILETVTDKKVSIREIDEGERVEGGGGGVSLYLRGVNPASTNCICVGLLFEHRL